MDENTIKKLNRINLDFYNTTAKNFDDARQYFWQGWDSLIKYFEYFNQLELLDLGCGNTRFFQFIKNHLPDKNINYLGLDSNHELLTFAQENFDSMVEEKKGNFELNETDIVTSLVEKKDFLMEKNFQVIVSFGVFHHIPSYDLRLQLLEFMKSKITDDGLIIISLWQFMEFERFRKKIVNDSQIENVNLKNLEINDFILDWKKGKEANRYCHFVDEAEQNKLIQQSNLELIETFRADGKEGNVNIYLVLKKCRIF